MANASPRDARAGYSIYRGAGGDIGIDALNASLMNAGYGPVSVRMLTHYRNLRERGFDRYISINRFDVARAASRYEDLGASPRYPYAEVGEGVKILIAKGSRLLRAAGIVDHLGEAGAIVRFVDTESAEGLKRLKVRPGDFVSLQFLESGRTNEGRITEVDSKSVPPALEVQFTELVSLASVEFGVELPRASLRLRLRSVDDSSVTTDQLGRRLFLIFEAVDEIRSIANEASLARQPSAAGYSPPAIVDRLTVASPAETVLVVSDLVKILFPVGIISGLLTVLHKFPAMRKTWHEGTGVSLDNEKKRLATQTDQLDKDKKQAEVELVRAIRDALDSRLPAGPQESVEMERIIETRFISLVQAMADSGILAIDELPGDSETSYES